MKYYNISDTDLAASQIIMGCMRIEALSTAELNRLILGELDLGINYFDHADVYGAGRCETAFGKAIDLRSSIRDKMIIQGKCGIRNENGHGFYDFSKEHIVRATEAILSRLKSDYLDVLLLHRPDTLMEPEEVSAAFDTLKASGKVKYFGLSNAAPMHFELLQKFCSEKLLFDQVQAGVGHTLLFDCGLAANTKFDQGIGRNDFLLEYSRLHGITLQAWSPMQYGMFRGYILDNPDYQPLNEVLEKIGGKYNVSKAAIAVAWLLRHPAKMQVICGSTKLDHVREYCGAANVVLTRAEWYEIYEAGGNIIP